MAEARVLARAAECLARIHARNGELRAVVARRDAAFIEEARASQARHDEGRPLSAVDGLAFTVKDNLLTRGLPATWGTAALRAYEPGTEELAVTRLREAGGLLLGKTNVPEFTLEGYTGNPVHGVTRHPFDPRLTPGGSSGGAVAAVASGMGSVAIATDGGGSIRRPCSYTGLFGLKPGVGAVGRDHALPPLMLDFETVGVIARSADDVRRVFEVIRDAKDDRPPTASARILYVPRLGDHPVDPRIAESVDAAAAGLRAQGHAVRESTWPIDMGPFERFWPEVAAIGLAGLFDARPDWGAAASPKWRAMASDGARLRARMPSIREEVAAFRAAVDRLFEEFDAVLMPSAAAMPWAAEAPYPTRIDGREVGPRGHAVFTGWVNAAGLPAVAVPCEPSPEGVPIGFQLVGPRGAENGLLDIAQRFDPGGTHGIHRRTGPGLDRGTPSRNATRRE